MVRVDVELSPLEVPIKTFASEDYGIDFLLGGAPVPLCRIQLLRREVNEQGVAFSVPLSLQIRRGVCGGRVD